jgi:beta-aspartyl-peptidase (threonine type)
LPEFWRLRRWAVGQAPPAGWDKPDKQELRPGTGAIVVHGGRRSNQAERELGPGGRRKVYRAGLAKAEEAGAKVLDRGGSALDAVEAAINVLEDDPLFNAGHGAVFTSEGKNELDSAIMDGSNLKAGAVAGVTRTRHPISLARAVMEKSPYVMLAGAGTDAFGAKMGLEQVDPGFFFTESRWQSLVKQLQKEGRPIISNFSQGQLQTGQRSCSSSVSEV